MDPRNKIRGKCLVCDCLKYTPPEAGLKCEVCSHPPGRHEREDKDPSSVGSESQILAVHAVQAFAATRCIYKDCGRPVNFDPNSGEESVFCEEHTDCDVQPSGYKIKG